VRPPPATRQDGIRIKVRDQGAVTVKVAYLVIGIDVEGRKHALGVNPLFSVGNRILEPTGYAAVSMVVE
jgi:hypothetical protein